MPRDAPKNAGSPSPLEGEGARRAGEGFAPRYARADWRTSKTIRLRTFAKSMRHQPTEAEAKLWAMLRQRRFAGYKFRRQLPIGPYIVDFVCLSAKLIVEADGSQHAGNANDATRDAYLAARGFRLLRVWNNAILAERDSVIDSVWAAVRGIS